LLLLSKFVVGFLVICIAVILKCLSQRTLEYNIIAPCMRTNITRYSSR